MASHSPPYPSYSTRILLSFVFSLVSLLIVFPLSVLCQSNIVLTPGVPYVSFVSQNGHMYFQVTIPATQTGELTVAITPLGGVGDPDLYGDFTNTHPNYQSQFQSTANGEDAFTILSSVYAGHSALYVGVSGWLASNFSLVATFDGHVNLLDGVPQQRSLVRNQYAYFDFTPTSKAPIAVRATSTVGSVAVYISGSTTPNATSYNMISPSGYSGEVLMIPMTAPWWPTDNHFRIGVRAISAGVIVSVSATLNGSVSFLQEGIPAQGMTPAGTYQYFTYVSAFTGCAIAFSVTPITGDPDMYVSRTNQQPTRDQNEKKSDRAGADTVVYTAAEATLGHYYIGIYAYPPRTASYSVIGSSQCNGRIDNSTMALINGVPQNGMLDRDHSALYRFTMTSAVDVTLSLSAVYGDPDIYVSTLASIQSGIRTPIPSMTSHTWYAEHYGSDFLMISSLDNREGSCTAYPCTLIISVYASSSCSYQLTAATATAITTLVDGQTFTDFLQSGRYEYFRIPVYDSGGALRISVTPVGRGNPDLYVSTTNPRPNANTPTNTSLNTWNSTSWREDTVVIPPNDPHAISCMGTPPCIFYVGVNAVGYNLTFQISVQVFHIPELQLGVPQLQFVTYDTVQYFRVHVPRGYQQIMITVEDKAGRSDVYISNSDELPDPDNLWGTSVTHAYYWYGTKRFNINETDRNGYNCHMPVGLHPICTYSIAVFAESDCTFKITAITPGITLSLLNNDAEQGLLTRAQYAYYVVRVDSPGLDLSVILTAQTGNPDLYYSNTSHPSTSHYLRKSTQYGNDGLDFFNAKIGIYYFAVYATENTAYTILSSQLGQGNDIADIISLQDGESQSTVTPRNHWRYYSFVVSDPTPGLTISVTRSYGDPDLYIVDHSTDPQFPSLTNHNWSSTNDGSDMIRLNNPKVTTYWIGVFAFSSCAYTITASTDAVVMTLIAGVPTRGSVRIGAYKYYQLYVDSSEFDVIISTTAYNGNPYIFVSTSNHFPNSTAYDWGWYFGSVTISKDDPKFCSHCYYFISVYGYFGSEYSIVGRFNTPILISDGVPSSMSTERYAVQSFIFNVQRSATEVTIMLMPSGGWPYAYIGTQPRPYSNYNYNWFLWTWYDDNSITIPSTDPSFCSACTYYIDVVAGGDSATVNYTLTASSTKAGIILLNGVPYTGFVDANHFTYFKYRPSMLGLDVVISVTPVNGDPDLYISFTNPNVSFTNYYNVSNNYGGDVLAYHSLNVSVVYIGVYGFRMNSTFDISAYEYSHTQIMYPPYLYVGRPLADAVIMGEFRYYRYWVATPNLDITVAATVRVGNSDLYINSNGIFPNATNKGLSQWKSALMGSDVITIPSAAVGTYIIGVYGNATSSYVITVSTNASGTILQDGVPVLATLSSGQYRQYSVRVNSVSRDLTIAITVMNGNPDLYVADFPNPSRTKFNHSAASRYGNDQVTIPASELRIGQYYIAVYGTTNCSYSIVATFTNVTLLQNGVPQSGHVNSGQSKYYLLEVGTENRDDLTVSANTQLDWVFLYMAPVRDGVIPPHHGEPSTYKWSSETMYTSQTLTAHLDEDDYCTEAICQYWIMVWGQSSANYIIVASYANQSIALTENVPVRVTINTGVYDYYFFYNPYARSNITLQLTAFSGDPDIYVSTIVYHPTTVRHTWSSTNYGSDYIHIYWNDTNYVPFTWYYISIFDASSTASSYSLLLTIADLSSMTPVTMLTDGMPQSGTLLMDQMAYYRFLMNTPADITIAVTPQYGDPDLYINAGLTLPQLFDANWSATAYGRDTIVIHKDAPHICIPSATSICYYTIGVFGASPTSYSIVASTQVAELQNGVSQMGYVRTGSSKLYSISVVSAMVTSLTISLTAYVGDPDLYVGYNFIPTRGLFNKSSTDPGTDVLSITGGDLRVGTYYMLVYGYSNSTFSISASVGAIHLVDGEPHTDKLRRNETRMYYFDYAPTGDPETSTISFHIDPSALNQVDLYVANWNNGTLPSLGHYQWSAKSGTPSQNLVVIRNTDTGACTSLCRYNIMAVGMTDTGVRSVPPYQITGSYGTAAQLLVDGRPAAGYPQDMGTKRYFRATLIDLTKDVNIAVSLSYGTVNLYADQSNPKPNMTSKWTASSNGGKSAHITATAGTFTTGIIYITVEAILSSAQYSIFLSTSNTMLTLGAPVVQQCANRGGTNPAANLFFFNVDGLHSDRKMEIQFLVELASSRTVTGSTDPVDVFVGTNSSFIDPRMAPTNQRELRQLTMSQPHGDSFFIETDDALSCEDCTFFIAVVCSERARSVSFSLTALLPGTDAAHQLAADDSNYGMISRKDGFDYYRTSVQQSSNFSIGLYQCIGDVYLYISTTTVTPSPKDASYADDKRPHQIRIYQTFQQLWMQNFYVGVRAATNDAAYVIKTWIKKPPEIMIDGSVTVDPHSPMNSITLKWDPVEPPKSHKPEDLRYFVYYAKHDGNVAAMYTGCGLRSEGVIQANSKPIEGTTTMEFTIGDLSAVPYDVNVLVVILSSDSQVLAEEAFTPLLGIAPSEASDEEASSSKILSYVLGAGVPILIIILIALIYLFYRNRRLTQELSIEMHDVPKAAVRKAVRDPSGAPVAASQRNYDRLLDNEEDIPQPGGYRPPSQIDEL